MRSDRNLRVAPKKAKRRERSPPRNVKNISRDGIGRGPRARPLRVLNGDALVSAPISHYDELVLADTVESFRKVARIVGSAMGWGLRTPKANLYVFHAQVNKLVQAGVLEAKGNTARMRCSEVRRVRKPKTAKVQ
jgi:hypothetical protein